MEAMAKARDVATKLEAQLFQAGYRVAHLCATPEARNEAVFRLVNYLQDVQKASINGTTPSFVADVGKGLVLFSGGGRIESGSVFFFHNEIMHLARIADIAPSVLVLEGVPLDQQLRLIVPPSTIKIETV